MNKWHKSLYLLWFCNIIPSEQQWLQILIKGQNKMMHRYKTCPVEGVCLSFPGWLLSFLCWHENYVALKKQISGIPIWHISSPSPIKKHVFTNVSRQPALNVATYYKRWEGVFLRKSLQWINCNTVQCVKYLVVKCWFITASLHRVTVAFHQTQM